VTLIAAFKCSDGFLVCADSAEICGPWKTRVDKISPKVCGNFQVAIAGSGLASVVDDCTLRLEDAISSLEPTALSDFAKTIHLELLDFRKNECTSSERQTLKFIISALAYKESARPFAVWTTVGSRLNPVETFAIGGWETEVYNHTAERLYRPRMLISQAVFAALYLLRLARDTSPNIDEPMKLVSIRSEGMYPVSPEYTKKLSDRMEMFAKQIDNFMLFCPDTSITKSAFERKLQEFEETIKVLREDYLQDAGEAMVKGEPFPMTPDRIQMQETPGGRTEFSEHERDPE
jgi:hypothetical protein